MKMEQEQALHFDIRMRTPIGIRLGHMTVCRNLGRISGQLDILKHSEPFEGTIDEEGNCEMFGKIITLMRTINYKAEGKITPDSMVLSIIDGRHVLEITGIPIDHKRSNQSC